MGGEIGCHKMESFWVAFGKEEVGVGVAVAPAVFFVSAVDGFFVLSRSLSLVLLYWTERGVSGLEERDGGGTASAPRN